MKRAGFHQLILISFTSIRVFGPLHARVRVWVLGQETVTILSSMIHGDMEHYNICPESS
jgi:hypothetical protein